MARHPRRPISKEVALSKIRKFILVMTGVNLLILICFTVCMFRISEMNRSINAAGDEFEYTESESGEVTLDLGAYGIASMRFAKDGVSIKESHLYDNSECLPKVLRFIRYYAVREGYEIARSNTELIGEYRLHTILRTFNMSLIDKKAFFWYNHISSEIIRRVV